MEMTAQFAMVLEELPVWLGALFAGCLGLIFGSFIAALVLRWPSGKGLGGRSHCDACGQTLAARDLVPLFSFLWLKGKGRCCGQPINSFHFRVEATAGAVGIGALCIMPGVQGWIWALMGWMLLPLILLDARHFWLPDRLNFMLAAAGLLLAGPLMGSSLDERWIGAMAAGLSLLLVRLAYRAFRGREGMGGGDPKLFAAIGAWLGWQALPFALLMASVTGLIWAVATQRKGDPKLTMQRVPFGIFLGAGGWCAAALWPLISR